MIAIGWMLVVLSVAAMALYAVLRMTSPKALTVRLQKAEEALASLPAAEDFLGRIDALEKKLSESAAPQKMVGIVNAHTADMLELKNLYVDLRREVMKMRTGEALRMTATGG